MLIGGNNGVTIVDTNGSVGGSSIALKNGGIGMHGSSIVLTTASDLSHDGNTVSGGAIPNAIVLDSTGIVMGTSGTIQLLSTNFEVRSNPASGENYFYVGEPNQTKYIRYTQAGVLEVKGTIYAEAGKIGS